MVRGLSLPWSFGYMPETSQGGKEMHDYDLVLSFALKEPCVHLSFFFFFFLLNCIRYLALVAENRKYNLLRKEVRILSDFQSSVQQCVASRSLGLTSHILDHCKLILKFPEGTNSTWYNEQFKIYEPLEYHSDVCETILLWEQYRNMTTVLTREYLDDRPNGWLAYAAKRIAQLGADKCYNHSLCEEHLNLILPVKPPFHPRQFWTCAVVGNSGDLLKTEFREEIDRHDAVIRDNEAPVNEKYAKYVGLKRDFRLVVRGAARNMVAILNGSADEVLIIKSVTHRDFNAMIKNIPNPVYLFQGIVLRRGAKGTEMKSIELTLSMCDIVDIYGFTVDPGYTEWSVKPHKSSFYLHFSLVLIQMSLCFSAITYCEKGNLPQAMFFFL
ncbi:sialyltransferase-like protein 1 [Telopea speciosissima]|uniref:sialyltransferase-like protein 1 n=1 Tax=Telopea speciosissima TaxID=54955 RepID=UPI001CC620C6|nr:sialyltransferase-like protein 1 [Telopea speciosissima]